MSKLQKNLDEWVALGFINPEQAKQILGHEGSKLHSSWVLSGLLILGALVISIGAISLIAANWQQIPPLVKLGGDFLILIVLAYGIVWSSQAGKPILFEILLLIFLMFCLASIGLISQIYNTGGELYQALLLWSLITCGIAFAARKMPVPFIWTGALLVGLVFTAIESTLLQPIFQDNFAPIFMAMPLFCAVLFILNKSLNGADATNHAFRAWILISGLIALIIADGHDIPGSGDTSQVLAYLPGYCLAVIVLLGIILSKEYHFTQKLLLCLALAIYLLLFHLPLMGVQLDIIYAVLSILLMALVAIFFASLGQRKLFQWFLFFIGLRFVILYFQALGGLAMTGIGLIISGGVIILIAILWNKYRTALAIWVERWSR